MDAISSEFVDWYLGEVSRLAARYLKIAGWELRTPHELNIQIAQLFPAVGKELEQFGKVYAVWAAQTRKDGTDTETIMPLIIAREAARDKLIQIVRSAA